MKALLCTSYGPTANLKIAEVPKPVPQEHEVLIKIHCTAVNDYDWSMVRGKPGIYRLFFGLFKPKKPIPGMELSGIIEAYGESVTKFNVGDAVYGDISDHGFGSFAEFIAIHEDAVVKKPTDMSFEDAASISHAANLAWQGLVDVGQIKQGMNILVNGAGGGVGTSALQIAKTYDCIVTGVDSGKKLKMMKEIGFDEVLDYKEVDFTKLKKKYDLILDAKTTRPPRAYVRVLKENGLYVTVGGLIFRLLQLFIVNRLFNKPVKMVGLKANKDLDKITPLYQKGILKPVVDGPYSLAKSAWAIQYFGEGKHSGKVIVSPLID